MRVFLNEPKWKWLKANARFGLSVLFLELFVYACVRRLNNVNDDDDDDDTMIVTKIDCVQNSGHSMLNLIQKPLSLCAHIYHSFIYLFSSAWSAIWKQKERKWHTLINRFRFRWIEFQNTRSRAVSLPFYLKLQNWEFNPRFKYWHWIVLTDKIDSIQQMFTFWFD